MTDRERAIVMAYTGIVMLAGDKLKIFYDYVEEITGKGTLDVMFADKGYNDYVKECAKKDFLALCSR